VDPDAKKLLQTAGNYSYIGIFLGVAILLGYLGGAWLDKRFHTQPWLTLAGLAVGIASGARELYRLARRGMKDEQSGQPKRPD
jgi:F0F1-type ATP synthase assembly protein I